MRKTHLLLFVLIIISCNNQSKKEHNSKPSSVINQEKTKEKIVTPIVKDTTKKPIVPSFEKQNDSTNYIGFVNTFYFSNSPEIYLELYFKSEISNYEEFDSISNLAKEVIYKDDENTRYKLPKYHASSIFDLSGLSQLHFFDSLNNHIGQTNKLKNYEYLEQNISPVFIASYKTEINPDKISYCISGEKPIFSELKTKKTHNPKIIYEIKEFIDLNDYSTSYTSNHFQYTFNSKILTFSNTNDYSFIHITDKGGKTNLIFKDTEFSNIIDVQIIPIIKNEMPILLCSFIRPETDMFWEGVLTFKNGKYEYCQHQRI